MLFQAAFVIPVVFLVTLTAYSGLSRIFPSKIAAVLLANVLSLVIFGPLSTIGFGEGDFPDFYSIARWSVMFIGPYQAIVLVVCLIWFLWPRGRSAIL
jgi:hypothetical protein